MKQLALLAIRFYQRFISPRKGFCCAYRYHTGRASCSVLGFRAIRRFGLWRGIVVLRERLGKCGVAHRRYRPALPFAARQAGFCDCDLPCDFDFGNESCDLPCDCDVGRSRKKDDEEDHMVHIPPAKGRSGE